MSQLVTREDDKRRIILIAAVAFMIVSSLLYLFTNGDEEASIIPPDISGIPANVDAEAQAEETAEKPAFDIVRISRGGTGIIAGRMAPGAEIELKANDELVAKATADENGEWVILLDEPLESGSVEFSLNGRSPGKDDQVEADDVVVVSVPERDDELLERSESGVVAVMTPRDGEGGSTVLQRPGGRAPSEIGDSLTVVTIDYGDGGDTVIAGTGVPRFEARLYINGDFAGNARVDDKGEWTIPVATALGNGQQLLRVDQTIGDGSVQLRIEQPFETGLDVDQALAASGVVVQPGNTLWHIARQLYGTGVRYTLIFKENSERIRDPDLIYPGQLFELPLEKLSSKTNEQP